MADPHCVYRAQGLWCTSSRRGVVRGADAYSQASKRDLRRQALECTKLPNMFGSAANRYPPRKFYDSQTMPSKQFFSNWNSPKSISTAAPYFSKIDMIGGFRKWQSPPRNFSQIVSQNRLTNCFHKSGDSKLSFTNPRDLCNKIFYRFYFYSVSQIDVDLSFKFGRYMMRTTSRFECKSAYLHL
jgi:hypothetical protein